jgi:hypothetical protein
MMPALTSMSSWVWLIPGDLVNVVLMNSALRFEKSFGSSAMTSPGDCLKCPTDGEVRSPTRQPDRQPATHRRISAGCCLGSHHYDVGG